MRLRSASISMFVTMAPRNQTDNPWITKSYISWLSNHLRPAGVKPWKPCLRTKKGPHSYTQSPSLLPTRSERILLRGVAAGAGAAKARDVARSASRMAKNGGSNFTRRSAGLPNSSSTPMAGDTVERADTEKIFTELLFSILKRPRRKPPTSSLRERTSTTSLD